MKHFWTVFMVLLIAFICIVGYHFLHNAITSHQQVENAKKMREAEQNQRVERVLPSLCAWENISG